MDLGLRFKETSGIQKNGPRDKWLPDHHRFYAPPSMAGTISDLMGSCWPGDKGGLVTRLKDPVYVWLYNTFGPWTNSRGCHGLRDYNGDWISHGPGRMRVLSAFKK